MMRLREALDGVPGHRSSQGRRHPLGAVLSFAVCAIPPVKPLTRVCKSEIVATNRPATPGFRPKPEWAR